MSINTEQVDVSSQQPEPRRIKVFDTTLRDGEQSPGVALGLSQKLEIAHGLARLGVDVIEAGFPISSPGDFEAVSRVAREVRGPVIAGLARAAKADIEAAARAVEAAARPRIHTFLATSPIHMEKKLNLTPEAVLERAVSAVRFARGFVDDVEFSAEDAGRSERDFLVRVCTAVIEAGATTINVPDTVGYQTPGEYAALVAFLRQTVPGMSGVTLSVHCHDDLGLATANSLAAVAAGAGQVECCINGIGERAGNASLEEIVMALYTRPGVYGASTGVNTREIYRVSRLVSRLTGMPVQPNKAIVGDNAFAHEAGIHQDGVLKARETYEIMNAELVGREAAVLVMGKHSGRAAFRKALTDLGYDLEGSVADHGMSADTVNALFARFKDLADRKGNISSEDLRALVETREAIEGPYRLESIQVVSGTHVTPMATVRLVTPDGVREEAATGDGPVDAAYRAINRITTLSPVLESYRIQAVTEGGDAVGEVSLRARVGEVVFSGSGVATDIVEASARAWLELANATVASVGGRRDVAEATV